MSFKSKVFTSGNKFVDKTKAVAVEEELEERFQEVARKDALDLTLGFARYTHPQEKLGWLVNMHSTILKHSDASKTGKQAVDLYFLEEDGGSFKTTMFFEPYFFVVCNPGTLSDVEEFLIRKYKKLIASIVQVKKEDLKAPNHLIEKNIKVLKLSFHNVQNLNTCKRILLPMALKSKLNRDAGHAYDDIEEFIKKNTSNQDFRTSVRNPAENIIDIREFDVPYYVRAAIDNNFRVGMWYSIKSLGSKMETQILPERVTRAEPVVLAFDIETTKLPLKFPDSSFDQIIMISYMIDGQGFLITNREILSEDINDFEYTPKPEYEGPFTIFNEPNEVDYFNFNANYVQVAVIKKFFEHIKETKPTVVSTYNGDFFDFPFIDARATAHGISMEKEIGFRKVIGGEYRSFYASHMDCFCWVKRDSYLPQGSQGLKAVTTVKLGYNPMEVDPEDMTRFAAEKPQVLAQYSVSDAVATYYLYMKYVHPFIFSLCNIIPMNPDDVLRKGSGTLCETLLMVESFKANILMPNKHSDAGVKLHEGRLLDSETYVGGHVEALEAGVFRSDLATKFKLVPEALNTLISEIDAALKFNIETEGKLTLADITNYEEVRDQIVNKLTELRDNPLRNENPTIYHLDVAAMYPNIILTNRLQPDAIVDEQMCAACDFNEGEGSLCQKRMTWSWRGEIYSAKRSEYNMILNQLETEKINVEIDKTKPPIMKSYHELSEHQKNLLQKKRVTEYSKKVYSKLHETKVVEKEAIVCQRENPFYVDTVRDFRDRRYEYKDALKKWKKKLEDFLKVGDINGIDSAKKLIVVYDSLQLAHKCILNSFYGYVMRTGARWYSMEMAGIVCLTGAKIIQLARIRIEQVGRPLELDTDGVWCIFPSSFPENFKFKLKNGKVWSFSYPGTMLNHLVHDQFTNHQYQVLKPVSGNQLNYEMRSENSIFFEVDGPYKAMILPASKEADKLLKKRYAVFNLDGSIAELKGFELKRRGELKLIKEFQKALFKLFLKGSTLQECYEAVAGLANSWLDILLSKGANLADDELFELISENRSMSKSLEEYGDQKSTSINTAKRLAEFLGDQMVKDKGLNCKFIIAAKPYGTSVSERSVPLVIFQAETTIKKHYLRKWLKDNNLNDFDIRSILDWQYYLERFNSVVQKLITIPAAMQKISNPIPRIPHPEWLQKRIASVDDKIRQFRITEIFQPASEKNIGIINDKNSTFKDMEDLLEPNKKLRTFLNPIVSKKRVLDCEINSGSDGEVNESEENVELKNQNISVAEKMQLDYGGWLKKQKVKWRKMRAERDKARAAGRPKRKIATAADHFRTEKNLLYTSCWDILQIVETDIPGEFKIWAMVNQSMHLIRITVPRIFYINKKTEDLNFAKSHPDIYVEKCNSILPRCHPTLNLYRMTMLESTYLTNSALQSGIFNGEDVAGVYETQVPLLFRALLKVGCRASLKKDVSRNADDILKLSDLVSDETSPRNTYLQGMDAIKYLVLCHAKSGSRQVYVLFTPMSEQKATIVFVDSAKNYDQLPNPERLYEEVAEVFFKKVIEKEEENDSFAFQFDENLEFYPKEVVSTDAEAREKINLALRNYKDNRKGPTLLIIGSPLPVTNLVDGIAFIRDYPFKVMPHPDRLKSFSALGWQIQITRIIIQFFFNTEKWIRTEIKAARYTDAPICNLESDWCLFSTDLMLARILTKKDMVLWYSTSEKPDLGGRQDDFSQVNLIEQSDHEISNPGTYGNVTLDISVGNLALNTIIQAAMVNELEGSTSIFGLEGKMIDGHIGEKGTAIINSSNYDQLNSLTFNIIRSMLKKWYSALQINNYSETSSKVCDENMLDGFYRWLTNTATKMHEPALLELIHGLMKKVFFQLISQLRKFGSEVVYANFDRIIINTTKKSVFKAAAYAKYILESVTNKNVLMLLGLQVEKMWIQVYWLDESNHGGFFLAKQENDQEEYWFKDMNETRISTINKAMNWNIADYLPPVFKRKFLETIGDYLDSIYYYDEENNDQYQVLRQINIEEEKKDNDDENPNIRKKKHFQAFLKTNIKRKLLKSIPALHSEWTRASDDPDIEIQRKFAFPVLPGSHLNLFNPALELINYICEVIGLDKELEWEVGILKRDLLMTIGFKQFNNLAKYQNPCLKYVLPHTVCQYCSQTKDLDLTSDPQASLHNEMEDQNETVKQKISSWYCEYCDHEYDKKLIEHQLITVFQKKLRQWHIQDLRCLRCKSVSMFSLRERCICSGELIVELNLNDILKSMSVFRNIAQYYSLNLLKEEVEFALMTSEN
ncbi:DNA polymerase epsilon catalytic subunit [Lobulomyces angularis]|nr:DNA polymerase epsilon catalytic subunit [Lobulomyces angularis]